LWITYVTRQPSRLRKREFGAWSEQVRVGESEAALVAAESLVATVLDALEELARD